MTIARTILAVLTLIVIAKLGEMSVYKVKESSMKRHKMLMEIGV